MTDRSTATILPTAFFLLWAAACSGGGGSSDSRGGGAGTSELTVELEPAATSDTALSAQVAIVALERPDGSLTANLRTGVADVLLADPAGTPTRIELTGVPPGAYVALRLLFHQIASGRVGSDRVVVRCEPLDARVPLAEPFEHSLTEPRWVTMRHRRELELADDGPGRRRFTPDFIARRGEGPSRQGEPQLPDSEGSIASVDLGAGTIRVVPRKDDPLLIAGRAVREAVLRAGPGTRFVFAGNASGSFGLADLRPSWRIWFKGSLGTRGMFDAVWVRARPE
jgi:hypothetical protein